MSQAGRQRGKRERSLFFPADSICKSREQRTSEGQGCGAVVRYRICLNIHLTDLPLRLSLFPGGSPGRAQLLRGRAGYEFPEAQTILLV